MTRKRVSGIQKFALLIALSGFVPGLAMAQEPPSSLTYGCYDPFTAAVFVCEDLVYDNGVYDIIGTPACRTYCNNMRRLCLHHVAATARCLDRVNKDLIATYNQYCNGYYMGDPEGRSSCRLGNLGYLQFFREIILQARDYGKDECATCYEDCLSICEQVTPR